VSSETTGSEGKGFEIPGSEKSGKNKKEL